MKYKKGIGMHVRYTKMAQVVNNWKLYKCLHNHVNNPKLYKCLHNYVNNPKLYKCPHYHVNNPKYHVTDQKKMYQCCHPKRESRENAYPVPALSWTDQRCLSLYRIWLEGTRNGIVNLHFGFKGGGSVVYEH